MGFVGEGKKGPPQDRSSLPIHVRGSGHLIRYSLGSGQSQRHGESTPVLIPVTHCWRRCHAHSWGGVRRGRLCAPPPVEVGGHRPCALGYESQGRCFVTAPHQEAPSALPPPETFPPDEITPASGEQAPIVKGWGPERKGVFQALKNSSPEIYESARTGIVPSSAQHRPRLCHTHPRP